MNKYTGDNLQNLEIPGQIRVTEAGQEVFLGPDDGWKVIIAGSWPSKLRAAGYTGKLELGAMIDACPLEYDGEPFVLTRDTDGQAFAYYWLHNHRDCLPKMEGTVGINCIEAVANLMIEHPELWRKCPR